MIIRFCILPAGLAGPGETAEKSSGQRKTNKTPELLVEKQGRHRCSVTLQNPKQAAPKPGSQLLLLLPFDSAFEGQA